MKYCFDWNDYMEMLDRKEPYEYWTEDEIRQIRLYDYGDPKISEDDVWPVYSYEGNSCDPVECDSEDAAYDEMMTAFNCGVYEYIHDI